jgi:hypothetical protein
MICPQCGYMMDAFDKECPRCHGKAAPSAQTIPQPTAQPGTAQPGTAQPGTPQSAPQTQHVWAPPSTTGAGSYVPDSVPDAKLRIKELKLQKKEIQAQKKEVAQQIAAIRAKHRSSKVNSAPLTRGGGFIASTARTMRQVSAMNVDSVVGELERQKAALDGRIAQLDSAILQCERYILDNTPRP